MLACTSWAACQAARSSQPATLARARRNVVAAWPGVHQLSDGAPAHRRPLLERPDAVVVAALALVRVVESLGDGGVGQHQQLGLLVGGHDPDDAGLARQPERLGGREDDAGVLDLLGGELLGADVRRLLCR